MKRWTKIPIIFALICSPMAVVAHDGATGIVKERMELMKAIGQSMKSLGAVFKGQVEYDPVVIEGAARDIQALSGSKMTALFPDGSLHQPSEALPTVWEEWVKFENLAILAESYSGALAAAANNPSADGGMRLSDMGVGDGDPATLAAGAPQRAFGFLAKTCSNCHETFRMKKD